jgi:hypothetical protein
MSYSSSSFTVEVNGVPAVVFQTKWHGKADEICRAWAHQHWDQLTTKGRHAGLELPPIIKLRLASADEKAAYEVASKGAEHHDGVKIVYLVDMTARPWGAHGIA